MPCPLLIVSQSDYLIQIADANSNFLMAHCVDLDLFRSQLIWICTVCKSMVYPGSAGPGLTYRVKITADEFEIVSYISSQIGFRSSGKLFPESLHSEKN